MTKSLVDRFFSETRLLSDKRVFYSRNVIISANNLPLKNLGKSRKKQDFVIE